MVGGSIPRHLWERYRHGGLSHVVDGIEMWWTNRVFLPVHNWYHRTVDPGVQVTDEDWDNLLVLDACRADLFESVVSTGEFDDYRRVTSRGSSTVEWTRNNFEDGTFGDVVYTTGNPNTSALVGNSFHELREVWLTDYDEEMKTVRPESILAVANDAVEAFPHKRHIVHFMQPHHPFVPRQDMQFEGWTVSVEKQGDIAVNPDIQTTPWDALESGDVTPDAVWDAYQENLKYVLEKVLPFARTLPGKTVITSDHGNAFGERALFAVDPFYGHPPKVRIDALTKVPWAVIDGKRRTTVDEGAHSSSEAASSVVGQRLSDLGYV